jgi:hypothetical protein
LEVQGIHLAISLRVQKRAIATVVADILTRALLVQGITPVPGEWAIEIPDTSSFDEQLRADVFAKRAAGVLDLVNAGVPLRQALKEGFGYDDEELDAIQEAIDVNGASVIAAVEAAARKGLRVIVEGGSRATRPENQPG